MNCRKCGSRIREGQKFCIECGAAVAQPEQSTKKTVSQDHGEQKKEKLVTCYDVLEIMPTASEEIIHTAYQALSKKYDPATYPGDKGLAEHKMQMINKAYGVLSDPEIKRKYDLYLQWQNVETTYSKKHIAEKEEKPKKKKHISMQSKILLGIASLLAVLAVCGILYVALKKDTPIDVVTSFCDHMKNFDIESMQDCMLYPNDNLMQSEMESGPFKDALFECLAKNANDIEYQVISSDFDEETGKITVNFSYIDSYPIVSATITDFLQQSMLLILGGANDSLLESTLTSIFYQKYSTMEHMTAEAVICFECQYTEAGWKIVEVNEDFLNVLTSNIFAVEDLFDDIGSSDYEYKENTATEIAEESAEQIWITAMASAAKGTSAFSMEETGSDVNIYEITKLGDHVFEEPLIPVQFAVVNMDQDGSNEIIIELTNNFDGWRIILRYYEGTVYGYSFVYRGLQSVSTTGLAISSSGASDSDVFRLHFNGHEMYQETLSEEYAFSNWEDVAWHIYSSENIDKFITDESMISEPVDLPIPSETHTATEDQTTVVEGYVAGRTGGLNIRNGPGTSYAQIGRLAEYSEVSVWETQWADGREWGRIEAGWICMDYIVPGKPDPASTNNVYALDYVNATTGSVCSRLGTKIIYSGGFAGSNLFYLGNNSNMQFGYIPHDWNNPIMTGDEAITIIFLSGNAKISSNLSANMTKAELDAAAWNTPGVQNVSSESYYSEIAGGSVYQYKIETSSARIIYEWYLDLGDSINSSASDVSVSPK